MGGNAYSLTPEATSRLRESLRADAVATGTDGWLAPLLRERLVVEARRRRSWWEGARSAGASAAVEAGRRLADRGPMLTAASRRLLHTARWAIVLFGWAETVRAWERRYPDRPGVRGASAADLEAIDRSVRAAAAHSLAGHECKERALACLALVRKSAASAQLLIGIAEPPLRAHVWVEAGGVVLSDDADTCARYSPVARYTGTGTPVSA